MTDDLLELYQAIILDHSKRPRNRGEILDGAIRVTGDNPSCGDEVTLDVKLVEPARIADLKFTGQGCAISQASASLMTIKVMGKSVAAARELLAAMEDLLTSESPGEPSPDQLGDLILLQGVRKFPQRVKCAMLAWRALEQALQKYSA